MAPAESRFAKFFKKPKISSHSGATPDATLPSPSASSTTTIQVLGIAQPRKSSQNSDADLKGNLNWDDHDSENVAGRAAAVTSTPLWRTKASPLSNYDAPHPAAKGEYTNRSQVLLYEHLRGQDEATASGYHQHPTERPLGAAMKSDDWRRRDCLAQSLKRARPDAPDAQVLASRDRKCKATALSARFTSPLLHYSRAVVAPPDDLAGRRAWPALSSFRAHDIGDPFNPRAAWSRNMALQFGEASRERYLGSPSATAGQVGPWS